MFETTTQLTIVKASVIKSPLPKWQETKSSTTTSHISPVQSFFETTINWRKKDDEPWIYPGFQ